MATNYTLKIDAGADFYRAVRLKDESGEYIELANCSARMALKKAYDSPEAMISLTSDEGGGITFGRWDNDSMYIDTCLIHITNKQTGGLVDYTVTDSDGEVEQGEGVYDLEIEDASGSVLRVIQGAWIAYQETTR